MRNHVQNRFHFRVDGTLVTGPVLLRPMGRPRWDLDGGEDVPQALPQGRIRVVVVARVLGHPAVECPESGEVKGRMVRERTFGHVPVQQVRDANEGESRGGVSERFEGVEIDEHGTVPPQDVRLVDVTRRKAFRVAVNREIDEKLNDLQGACACELLDPYLERKPLDLDDGAVVGPYVEREVGPLERNEKPGRFKRFDKMGMTRGDGTIEVLVVTFSSMKPMAAIGFKLQGLPCRSRA